MIKVRFVLRCVESFGSRKIIPPPDGSEFEIALKCLPKMGDILHIHKDLLPVYYRVGGASPDDVKIDLGENSGEFRDTVKITIVGTPVDNKDWAVHVIRPESQITMIMFCVDRYERHGWQDFKK